MKLPKPSKSIGASVSQAIAERRTVRRFDGRALSMAEFSQILWAAYGITGERGFKRAAPSAGALYPMDVYAVIGENAVETRAAGVYHYQPEAHAVSHMAEGDLREEIARASLGQMWMAAAPVHFVITAEYARSMAKYGKRGIRYAMIEAGGISQNLFLQTVALGLSAGIVGAFTDEQVIRIMRIPQRHEPLLIMPVGRAG